MAEQNPGQGSAPIITLAKCPRCGWTACTCDLAADARTAPARHAVEPIAVGTATIDPGSGPFEARGMWAPRDHGQPVFIDADGEVWAAGLVVSFEADDGQARCAHGATAEELCNRLPSDTELADMRQAVSTVTRLQERLGRLTHAAVAEAIAQHEPVVQEYRNGDSSRVWCYGCDRELPAADGASASHQAEQVIALVAQVPDHARAAELIRFHLQRPDISPSDRAELAAFADSIDAKPDPRRAPDAPRCDVDPVAHEERLAYLEPDDGQE